MVYSKEKTFVLNPNIYYITSLQGCWLASLSIKLPPKDDLKTEDNFPLQRVWWFLEKDECKSFCLFSVDSAVEAKSELSFKTLHIGLYVIWTVQYYQAILLPANRKRTVMFVIKYHYLSAIVLACLLVLLFLSQL